MQKEFTELFNSFILQQIPSARPASGRSVLNCRCMECGDSRDPHSRHMYIFPPTGQNPIRYYCHLCHSTGLLDSKKLIEWGVYDINMGTMVDQYNQSFLGKKKYRRYDENQCYQITNRYITMDDTTLIKMQYINNRLGLRLTQNDFLNLKIVLNLKDLLQSNNIQRITRNESIINDLDRAFVGFLSVDNAFVCLRKIDNSEPIYSGIDQRYVDYRIFEKENEAQKFYTIPLLLNLAVPQVHLHIAEGAFDILSIYMNLRNQEPGIYTSATGSNYMKVILYFLYRLKVPNLVIHLYPDNDKYGDRAKMEYIRNFLRPLRIPIYVHRNIAPNEKDFGVSKDRIIESIIPFNEIAQTEQLYNQ